MIHGKRFLEMFPIPSSAQNDDEVVFESIHESLRRINTVYDFFQRIEEQPEFLRKVFESGRYLWIKRRPNLSAYFRSIDTLPPGGSWLRRTTLVPLTIDRVMGADGEGVADVLFRSGLAVRPPERVTLRQHLAKIRPKVSQFINRVRCFK